MGGILADAAEVVPEAVGLIWDLATANPLLTFFLGVTIIGIGVGIFQMLKEVVHR